MRQQVDGVAHTVSAHSARPRWRPALSGVLHRLGPLLAAVPHLAPISVEVGHGSRLEDRLPVLQLSAPPEAASVVVEVDTFLEE